VAGLARPRDRDADARRRRRQRSANVKVVRRGELPRDDKLGNVTRAQAGTARACAAGEGAFDAFVAGHLLAERARARLSAIIFFAKKKESSPRKKCCVGGGCS